jgi:hypothetical protein
VLQRLPVRVLPDAVQDELGLLRTGQVEGGEGAADHRVFRHPRIGFRTEDDVFAGEMLHRLDVRIHPSGISDDDILAFL